MKHKYSVHIVWSEDDKAYLARVLELPGCMADGASHEEVLKNLDTVIDEWIETAKELKREIPKPLDTRQLEELARSFRKEIQKNINREVETAVQRVLQDIARSQASVFMGGGHVFAGGSDPAEWWKRLDK
jgi:predicted RNase H-like HicB family nuclease